MARVAKSAALSGFAFASQLNARPRLYEIAELFGFSWRALVYMASAVAQSPLARAWFAGARVMAASAIFARFSISARAAVHSASLVADGLFAGTKYLGANSSSWR